MKLLLDTHILLWWLADDARLSAADRARIADPDNAVVISAVSAYEVALKNNLGRLDWGADALAAAIAHEGFAFLPLGWAHLAAAGGYPLDHRDPFDRLLVTHCQLDGCELVTSDRNLIALAASVLGSPP